MLKNMLSINFNLVNYLYLCKLLLLNTRNKISVISFINEMFIYTNILLFALKFTVNLSTDWNSVAVGVWARINW